MRPPDLPAGAIDRRRFLTAAALAAWAGWPAGARPAACGAAKPPRFGGFTVAVQSYCFRNFDLEPALKRIGELGVQYVEFYQKHAPLDSTQQQIRAIQELCKEYGVTPIAWGVQKFTKDHDANRKCFDFGRVLGIKHFSADPDPDSFDSLDKLCAEYRIGVAIHPHGPIGPNRLHRWYCAEAILEAVKDRHELIGSCLDTGHLIRAAQAGKKLDPAQQVRVMGKRNLGLHLKDHDNDKKTDVVYGKGALDVAAVLRELRQAAFAGWISIEYEANPDNPSPDMAECLKVLEEAAGKMRP
jgi:inosose dehydratase